MFAGRSSRLSSLLSTVATASPHSHCLLGGMGRETRNLATCKGHVLAFIAGFAHPTNYTDRAEQGEVSAVDLDTEVESFMKKQAEVESGGGCCV